MGTVFGRHTAHGFGTDSGEDWRKRSVCREEDPDLFFPIGSALPALRQEERAKKVCARCPVSTACLKWALETGESFGVWGGTTEMERRAMKRRGVRVVPS